MSFVHFPGATDADSNDENVTFILVNEGGAAGSGNPVGYVHLGERPVTRFTQRELVKGRVYFTHQGKYTLCT